MATHQGDESLNHPSVKKFGTVDGAAKNTVDPATNDGTHTTSDLSGVMASVREGTQTGK